MGYGIGNNVGLEATGQRWIFGATQNFYIDIAFTDFPPTLILAKSSNAYLKKFCASYVSNFMDYVPFPLIRGLHNLIWGQDQPLSSI